MTKSEKLLKLTTLSIEEGQRINDILITDPSVTSNITNCLRAYTRNKAIKLEELDTNIYLYKYGDKINGSYFAININTNQILYFVKYYSKTYLNLFNNTVRGTMTFRLSSEPALSRISTKIFFTYLLNEYDVVTSDAQETLNGERVWQGLITDALSNASKYDVYAFNCNTRKVSKITNALDPLIKTVWGPDHKHQGIRAAIAHRITPCLASGQAALHG